MSSSQNAAIYWKNKNKNLKKNFNNVGFNPNDQKQIQQREKREYFNQKNLIQHRKIKNLINKNFSFMIGFEDICKIHIKGNNLCIKSYWYRYTKSGRDWLLEPHLCMLELISIFPIFKKLVVWMENIREYNTKYIMVDFVWRYDEDDLKESFMASFQALFVAYNALLQYLENMKLNDPVSFRKLLGMDFNFFTLQRVCNFKNSYKYIMNNAYITPKFNKSRNVSDDTTLDLVRRGLVNKYKQANIQVVRMGSTRQNVILSKKLLITSSEPLDLQWLNKKCRKVNCERVNWEKFENNKKNVNNNGILSNKERLREFSQRKIIMGKHKGLTYVDNDNNENKNDNDNLEIIIPPTDFDLHVKAWNEDWEEITSKSALEAIKRVIPMNVNNYSGSDWINYNVIQKKNYINILNNNNINKNEEKIKDNLEEAEMKQDKELNNNNEDSVDNNKMMEDDIDNYEKVKELDKNNNYQNEQINKGNIFSSFYRRNLKNQEMNRLKLLAGKANMSELLMIRILDAEKWNMQHVQNVITLIIKTKENVKDYKYEIIYEALTATKGNIQKAVEWLKKWKQMKRNNKVNYNNDNNSFNSQFN